jgi:hypothetical protein
MSNCDVGFRPAELRSKILKHRKLTVLCVSLCVSPSMDRRHVWILEYERRHRCTREQDGQVYEPHFISHAALQTTLTGGRLTVFLYQPQTPEIIPNTFCPPWLYTHVLSMTCKHDRIQRWFRLSVCFVCRTIGRILIKFSMNFMPLEPILVILIQLE